MTAIASATAASAPVAALPPIDPALEPANVRNGDRAAKNAYQTGLAFEDMLVSELVQQLTATVPGLDGSGTGASGSDGSTDGSDGSSGGSQGSVLGAYAPLLGQALTSQIMADGGTGIAMQIARSIDPALDNPPAKGTGR